MRAPAGASSVTGEAERIPALDVLRGIAVLGILPVNVLAFAYPFSAKDHVHLVSPASTESVAQALMYAFFDGKFVTVFTLLFGAGLAIQTSRRGFASARALWRLALLAGIGVVHALALWHGDILFVYAICGLFLLPLLRLSPRALALLGCVILAAVLGLALRDAIVAPAVPVATGAGLSGEQLRDIAVFKAGSLPEIIVQRYHGWRWTLTSGLGDWWWRYIAVMALGAAACRAGLFSPDGPRGVALRRALAIGAAIGLPLEIGHAIVRTSGLETLAARRWAEVAHLIGSLALATAYASAVMLLPAASYGRSAVRCMAAVGRLGLTNYLAQSVLCSCIFYSFGAALYADVTRAQLAMLVLAIWSVQVVASVLWLRFFVMGPVEWAWRCGTWLSLQPIRRRGISVRLDARATTRVGAPTLSPNPG